MKNDPFLIPWPETLIGFLLVLELTLFLLLGMTSPTAFTAAWFGAFWMFWRLPAATLIPLWVVFRMIDLLFAGPARRKRLRIICRVP